MNRPRTMRSNKVIPESLSVQRLKDGQFLVRAQQASGRILTRIVSGDGCEDTVLTLLATKIALKEQARLADLDQKLGLDKIYPSLAM